MYEKMLDGKELQIKTNISSPHQIDKNFKVGIGNNTKHLWGSDPKKILTPYG